MKNYLNNVLEFCKAYPFMAALVFICGWLIGLGLKV